MSTTGESPMFAPATLAAAPEVNDVWDKTLCALSEHYNLNPRGLSIVRKAKPLTFLGNNVLVAVPHEGARAYLESNIRDELSSALSEVYGYDVGFGVHIDPSLEDNVIGVSGELFEDNENANPFESNLTFAPAPNRQVSPPQLNPAYTFKTFVTGSSNRLAHATSFAVAEGPATAYNPHFIYGGSGLGKTHLLHAIGHYAYNLYPHLRVKYLNAESFFTDYIESVKSGELMSSFRRRYRDIDILLIDDIQFLGGKSKGLEEFFHTFEALHGQKRQIVITSDLPPKQLPGFEDRYTSRFSWGMIANVEQPELETRIAILRKKREAQSIDISDDILNYIATRIITNIRELEGGLTRVAAFASLNGQAITMQLVEEVLRDIVSEEESAEISPDHIMGETARYFSLSVNDLLVKSRLSSLIEARSIAMYLCRELTELSYPEIGRIFNRHHSTVITAFEKITKYMSEREATYRQVSELTSRIKQQ
jgi:chromosomal replication initiator protein